MKITLNVPEWMVWLAIIYMVLSTVDIVLNFYLLYLKNKIKNLSKYEQ